MSEDEIGTLSSACKAMLGGARKGSLYTPYAVRTTLQTPGELGGSNWSGGSVDPTGKLFVNTNNIFSIGKLEEQVSGSPERFLRNNRTRDAAFFWDAEQKPCQQPPWGMLSAVQYIAVAAGGGGMFNGKVSDAVMVFSLPRQ